MSMSMTTDRSHRSCLYFLYDLRVNDLTPCNYFTLLLTGSHSSRSNSWRATSWRHDDGDHDDGDHGVMPVTKMLMAPRRWRSKEQYDTGHIMSLFDCM